MLRIYVCTYLLLKDAYLMPAFIKNFLVSDVLQTACGAPCFRYLFDGPMRQWWKCKQKLPVTQQLSAISNPTEVTLVMHCQYGDGFPYQTYSYIVKILCSEIPKNSEKFRDTKKSYLVSSVRYRYWYWLGCSESYRVKFQNLKSHDACSVFCYMYQIKAWVKVSLILKHI